MRNSSVSMGVVAVLAAAALLQGCSGGGGGGSAAVAPASVGVTSGVVTGFGSVFVDGVEINDTTASVVQEGHDGTTSNTILQVGQHVRVEHDASGSATKVTLDAALMGSVSAVDAVNFKMTVAGQEVKVNTNLANGPLTVWAGGYNSIADVAANDLVEVHGAPVFDASVNAYVVNATRIQKTAAITTLKVTGKISNLNTSAKTFSLNGLTVAYSGVAAIRPQGATLANGSVVNVYAPPSGISGNNITASGLKIADLKASVAVNTVAQLGGQISLYDAAAKTFSLSGMTINASSATITPANATLANNAYVKIKGSVSADGSVAASEIVVREQNVTTDLASIKLKGVISDFVSSTSFVVRGVPVDASGVNLTTGCPGVTLANNVAVQIVAKQQAGTQVVYASSVTCAQDANEVLVKPIDGQIATVDATSKTFVVTLTGGGTQPVTWNANTTFIGLTAATLGTQVVRVEGYTSGTAFIAKVVRVPGASAEVDEDKFQRKSSNDTSSAEWNNYRSNSGQHN